MAGRGMAGAAAAAADGALWSARCGITGHELPLDTDNGFTGTPLRWVQERVLKDAPAGEK
ncbi:hypothetical protein COCSUDRAFT_60532 [Coccomyxa subellipsoidea C-169]|uniref:Uncharacterized protein n=1 Tax=Coccomyxa subellipsoidea (strain C-169) TaxID=574566 RepID=I0YIE0_COCSC|nr:hypothetical protein COCSUDRAFT_60532 [Coccomyxa subellipsoidea C-169]EIE18159.1 hypothetical protein COCSUDRAFT_60532 [Coccomyxa subellipsoidea C-169]|eukprot:XP_005642703.1 hypothetical protein COCSUDRAFT_60532 [Coccomyxa subellipsoidea C-169]